MVAGGTCRRRSTRGRTRARLAVRRVSGRRPGVHGGAKTRTAKTEHARPAASSKTSMTSARCHSTSTATRTATGAVFSSATGGTYWVYAQGPEGSILTPEQHASATASRSCSRQGFKKNRDDATSEAARDQGLHAGDRLQRRRDPLSGVPDGAWGRGVRAHDRGRRDLRRSGVLRSATLFSGRSIVELYRLPGPLARPHDASSSKGRGSRSCGATCGRNFVIDDGRGQCRLEAAGDVPAQGAASRSRSTSPRSTWASRSRCGRGRDGDHQSPPARVVRRRVLPRSDQHRRCHDRNVRPRPRAGAVRDPPPDEPQAPECSSGDEADAGTLQFAAPTFFAPEMPTATSAGRDYAQRRHPGRSERDCAHADDTAHPGD